MSESSKAVFLSYASQDKEVARKICEALRAAGLEVWFDVSELRGGDAWDQKIRKQIKECALFVPLITETTNSRPEGYFRLEWKLAVDRSHLLADDHPFLFPIVIGNVSDATARVPDKFRDVQWTRLRLDETPAEIADRVTKLLSEGQSAKGAAEEEAGRPERKAKPKKEPSLPRKLWRYIILIMVAYYALRTVIRGIIRDVRGDSDKPAAVASANPETPAAPVSEAKQLAAKARVMIDAIDSTADDFAAAEALAKHALELDPTDGEVWALASRVQSGYLSRGFDRDIARKETARTQAERALKLAPELPEAWLALGRAINTTDRARSEEALRHGLALAPKDGRLLLALGSTLRLQNRFGEALAVYEQAAALPESRALALYDQYLIHFYSRRFAEADRCLRESIAVSKSGNMVSGLAWLEVTWKGDVPKALAVLAEMPGAVRGQPRVVLTTAIINMMAGKPEAALKAFDLLPADYINDAWYTGPKGLLVGLAHRQAGRAEAARIAWEAAITVTRRRLQEAPTDLEIHLRLGELLAWTGQTEAALQEARIFDELQRGRLPDWTYSSVRIQAALGRADDALPVLEQLLVAPESHRWPLTRALLRLDPLWDKLRDDPRFQKLAADPGTTDDGPRTTPSAAAAAFPQDPDLAKAMALVETLNSTVEDHALAEDFAKGVLARKPTDAEAVIVNAYVANRFILRGFDITEERFAQARKLCERAVLLVPDNPEALHVLGQFLTFRKADLPRSVELLRRAVTLQPDRARFYNSYIEALEQNNDRGVLQAAQDAVARFPQDAILRYRLALTYAFSAGDLEAYEKALDDTLAIGPVATAIIRKAALLMTVHQDFAGARKLLKQMPASFRMNDRAVTARYGLAMASGEAADVDEAIQALNAIPGSFVSDFGQWPKRQLIGDLYARVGKTDLARQQFEGALADIAKAATSGNPGMYGRAKRWTLVALGRQAEAQADASLSYSSAARPFSIRGTVVTAYSHVPTLLVTGERAKALELLREAVSEEWGRRVFAGSFATDPHLAPWRDDAEIKAILAGPPAKAAVRDWPKNPELKKAVALLDRFDCIPEDLRLAEEIAQHVLDSAPTDPENVTAMARVQAMWLNRGWDRSSDRYLKTQKITERAVQLAPDEPEALAALACYLNQRGSNAARARQLLERAIELAPNEPRFHRWRNELIWGDRSVPDAVAFVAVERTLAQFPNDALVHYDASRHYRMRGRLADSLREIDATLAIAPVANALVWKARILFGFNNDLAAMKAALDLVPERVRSIERTVFGYFVYAVMSGDYLVGVKALNDMPDRWMIDFDYRGPKALLLASLLEQQHKPALARIQHEIALKELKERQASDPDDAWLKLDEAWVLHGLGRGEEARAALQVYNEAIERPYRMAKVGSWWFYPIAANLILGERPTALALIREAAETTDGRETVRRFLAADPRLVAFRDDAEIKALLAGK